MENAKSLAIRCLADMAEHYDEYKTHGLMFMIRKDLIENVKWTLELAGLVSGAHNEISRKVNALASWTEDTGVVNGEGFGMSMLSFPSGLSREDVLGVLSAMAGLSDGFAEFVGPNSFVQVHVA